MIFVEILFGGWGRGNLMGKLKLNLSVWGQSLRMRQKFPSGHHNVPYMQAASVHLEQYSSALTLQCVCARRTVRPPPPLISASLSSLSPCRSEWWPEGWTSVPHRGSETMTSHGSWHHRLWGATGPMPQNVGLRLCSEQIVSVSYLRTEL